MLFLVSVAAAAPAYLRQPDIHGDTVAFVADGDLWTAPTTGTEAAPASARRVTASIGAERMPRFSPDGRWIAFTGEYSGNGDVYVIPVTGGEPRRLTWHPDEDMVLGWSPDGSRVYFRSRRSDPNGSWRVYSVPAVGGEAAELPLGWAGWLDVDPQSGRYAFTRTGFESRTWKRYRGGTADDLWAGDPKTGSYARVTTFAGQDSFPMWYDGRLYFLSDEGGTGRLWRVDADGKNRASLTTNVDWDARWPAMGPGGAIVYMLGGDLRVFDVGKAQDRALWIDVPVEGVSTRVRYTDAASHLDALALSPEGDRLVIGARGEVWSVPVKEGVSLPVTHDSGARERAPSFSGDGKQVYYVTDASGEEAIARRDAWGRGEEEIVVPAGKTGWHFPVNVSPDGKWIAWADQTQTVYVAPTSGGSPKVVDRSEQAEIREYTWSADSRWLAYSKVDRLEISGVYVYDTKDGAARRVTPATVSERSPAWDPEGRYLYTLADIHVSPVIGARDFEYVVTHPTVPHAILLRPDVASPFLPTAGLPDAGGAKAEEPKDDKKKKKDDKKKGEEEAPPAPTPVEITFDGIVDRAVAFPVPASALYDLRATATGVYWVEAPVRGMTDAPPPGGVSEAVLMRFDLEKRKPEVFYAGLYGYDLSQNGQKLALVTGPGSVAVVDAGAPVAGGVPPEAGVSLGDVVITLDPREEWRQMYYEAWRNMRDFHWDPAMGGVPWEKMRDQYAKLLPRLANRGELNDLLGELIGELGTSHTYVGGGDALPGPAWVGSGQLGADVVREGNAFRVTRLYRADPADEDPNPLLAPGVNVKEGEYILAVNHRTPAQGEPLDALLAQLAGRRVVLTVNTRPTMEGAREVVVVPVGSDRSLRYHDWVRRNREYVAEKSGGRFGYIHIPDMGAGGLVAFDTWFLAQADKEGLVIDCRWNRGGFVSQLILERLARRVVGFDRARGGGLYTYPARVLNGQLVVLTNEFAGSDGDIFPYSVQQLGLGPVIGQRSWGGVVGIRGDKPLVDGGFLTQPEYAFWWPGEGWALENRGVQPDIEVQNLPQDVARGLDPQLDRGIVELEAALKAKPPVEPAFGPEPKKSRGAYP